MSKQPTPPVTPPNTLKEKLGQGGLSSRVIELAQRMVEQSDVDFMPIGQRFLVLLQEGARLASAKRDTVDQETLINGMLFPAVQLKANGGMFGFPLVTAVAGRLVRFLEYATTVNEDMLEVVGGFATAIQALLLLRSRKKLKAAEENFGTELYKALDEACNRYYTRHGGKPDI